MPNYAKAKIYQVISPNHPVPYIGSTTQALSKRMAHHRSQRNPCCSRIILEAGDAYIELIEEYPCENREQLSRREGELIRQRECVNRCIAGRTKAEWYDDNKEEVKEYHKAYREANHEYIVASRKAYNDATKERRRAYNEANKERRREYEKAKRAILKTNNNSDKQTICPTV